MRDERPRKVPKVRTVPIVPMGWCQGAYWCLWVGAEARGKTHLTGGALDVKRN